MRYPGGKGKCYQRLLNLMPPHDHYIESHLGGGAVLRHKRPAKTSTGIDLDANVIERWQRESPQLCRLIHGDAAAYLSSSTFCTTTLVYADPPYWPTARRRQRVYACDYTDDDHFRLIDVLIQMNCMVMLSGYQSVEYDCRLRHWRKTTFEAKTHVGLRTECVWMNFDPPTRLHDGSHLGDTFREREVIRRRHARLLTRVAAMPAIERHEVLEMLNRQFGADGVSS